MYCIELHFCRVSSLSIYFFRYLVAAYIGTYIVGALLVTK